METAIEEINNNEAIIISEETSSPIDILGREPFVEQLMEMINLLSESRYSCTFAINGLWGNWKNLCFGYIRASAPGIQSRYEISCFPVQLLAV